MLGSVLAHGGEVHRISGELDVVLEYDDALTKIEDQARLDAFLDPALRTLSRISPNGEKIISRGESDVSVTVFVTTFDSQMARMMGRLRRGQRLPDGADAFTVQNINREGHHDIFCVLFWDRIAYGAPYGAQGSGRQLRSDTTARLLAALAREVYGQAVRARNQNPRLPIARSESERLARYVYAHSMSVKFLEELIAERWIQSIGSGETEQHFKGVQDLGQALDREMRSLDLWQKRQEDKLESQGACGPLLTGQRSKILDFAERARALNEDKK